MKITLLTVLIALVSFLFMGRAIRSSLKNKMGIRTAFLWVFLWACIGFFALFPAALDGLTRAANMQLRIFFVLVIAVAALFALVFSLMSKIDKLTHDLARAQQEISLVGYRLEQALKKANSEVPGSEEPRKPAGEAQ